MIVGDLSLESDNEKVINETINHFKRLDVLVSYCFVFFVVRMIFSKTF